MDPIVSDERDAVDGAFKTSSLRNIELTGPYMHNGGQATLEQVVYFYNRGGDRKDSYLKDLDCGNPLFINDVYGNSVVAPDSETGLIDNSGFKPLNGGNASNMAADMAGHRDVLDVTCNVSRANHETLNLSTSDVNDLVAFMKTLTDERVRWEQAPFDHPSLVITNGTVGDENKLNANVLKEQAILLPAVGAKGRQAKRMAELKSFESGLK
jgi:cytochrome c peroxidase